MMRSLAFRRRLGLAALATAALFAAAAAPASAFTADDCIDICGTGTGACTIDGTWDIDPESEIDCSGRDLTINIGGWLKVTDGSLTLKARNLTIDGGATAAGGVMAVEGTDKSTGEIVIELSDPDDPTPPTTHGNLLLKGAIRANGQNGGGNIQITASGNIAIENQGTDGIEAGGTGSGGSGGEIRIEAGGSVTVYDPIHAEGADSGDTGGGIIEIIAGGDLITDQDGHVNAPGRSDGGGSVSLTSQDGDVIIREHVEVDGIGETGDAGSIEIHAGDRVEIAEQMYARGGFHAGGGAAAGGSIAIEAGCGGAAVNASLYATGGQLGARYEGGSITVESNGDTTVGASVVLDTRGLASGGDGGQIALSARNVVSIAGTATLDVRGSTASPAYGGGISLRGCRVDVLSGATLDATANHGGTISLGASAAPPATGTQPLVIGSASHLRAAGATALEAGNIDAMPLKTKLGACSNDSTRPCQLGSECTVGCQTGVCNYANPDTGGVVTQFDVEPARGDNRSLSACESTCS